MRKKICIDFKSNFFYDAIWQQQQQQQEKQQQQKEQSSDFIIRTIIESCYYLNRIIKL